MDGATESRGVKPNTTGEKGRVGKEEEDGPLVCWWTLVRLGVGSVLLDERLIWLLGHVMRPTEQPRIFGILLIKDFTPGV